MAVVNLDDPSDVAAWNCRAPAPASQPVATPAGMEPVYQIGQPFLFDPENTWRDASKDAYDVCMPSKRRIIYTASQVQAMLAAAPRNATLYDPDDVAFPVQRSAEGADVPPELASIAKQASIAAAEVAAPIAPAREPLTVEQLRPMWTDSKFRGSGGQIDWFIEGVHAAERHHGITAAKKGGQHAD